MLSRPRHVGVLISVCVSCVCYCGCLECMAGVLEKKLFLIFVLVKALMCWIFDISMTWGIAVCGALVSVCSFFVIFSVAL